MDATENVLNIVKKVYPDEYDIVGKSTTYNIIKKVLKKEDIELVYSDKGSDLDLSESINLLFGLVQVIAAIIQIIEYRKNKKESIKKEDILTDLRESFPRETDVDIPIEDYDKIISEILSNDGQVEQ
ncbi:MAG: hypothetical protein AAFZ15_06695 [Bacteroidota bacterium]